MTVGLLSFANPTPTSKLILNFNYGPSWSSAPASYNTALATAQAMIQNAFPNTDATLNIEMGYGFFDETDLGTGSPVSANSSVGSDIHGTTASYSAIRAALAALPNPTTTLTALLNNTPSGTTLNTRTTFNISRSSCKALGLFSPGLSGGPSSSTDTVRDGAVGMGSGWSSAKLVGVFLHEITHAMGREVDVAPLVFSRFTSVGVRDFGSATSGAYFSLNNGTTDLADYDHPNDYGDFLNFSDGTGVQDQNDCFNAFQTSSAIQSLTALDIQLMNALGFQ